MDFLGAWSWWIFAAVLAILELLAPGVFFIWLAGAAVVVALVSLVLPLSFTLQLAIFAVFSVLFVWAGRRYLARHPIESDHPFLNKRGQEYVGEVFTLDQPIEDGRGKLKIGDGYWLARGPDLATGTKVRVVRLDGATLIVEPAA
ncbi:MAG: NfeD family protein [Rhizobiales bacterium]|nr:NfeD family protein [Hyphomicrobiales bacterium]